MSERIITHEIPTALFVSGSGSTARSVLEAYRNGELKSVAPLVVVSSRPSAPGPELRRVLQEMNVPLHVVERKGFANNEQYGAGLLQILRDYEVGLVSLNGFLRKLPPEVLAQYTAVNQHPGSLDPGRGVDFGGQGMYGSRVVAAQAAYMLATGEAPWAEATTHYAIEDYDKGPLIRVSQLQFTSPFSRPVTIAELRDNPRDLIELTHAVQADLLPLEHQNVRLSLEMVAAGISCGSLPSYNRETPLIPPGNEHLVADARALAIELFPKG